MEGTITFEGGSKIIRERLRQGLKPLIRIEVRRWKRSYHAVTIKARLEAADGWQEAIMSVVPIPSTHSRSWDISAFEMWQSLLLVYGTEYRHAYLTQHLSHLMFTYEVEVSDVSRKMNLTP